MASHNQLVRLGLGAIAAVTLAGCTSVNVVHQPDEVPGLLERLADRFVCDVSLCSGETVQVWRVDTGSDTLRVLDARVGTIASISARDVSAVRTVRVSPGNRVGPITGALRAIGIHRSLFGMHMGRPLIGRRVYRMDGSCAQERALR